MLVFEISSFWVTLLVFQSHAWFSSQLLSLPNILLELNLAHCSKMESLVEVKSKGYGNSVTVTALTTFWVTVLITIWVLFKRVDVPVVMLVKYVSEKSSVRSSPVERCDLRFNRLYAILTNFGL